VTGVLAKVCRILEFDWLGVHGGHQILTAADNNVSSSGNGSFVVSSPITARVSSFSSRWAPNH